jgi:hypothetical protein
MRHFHNFVGIFRFCTNSVAGGVPDQEVVVEGIKEVK